MLELRILVDDIDYDSIAEYLIPAVAEKLRREEKGGILGNVLAGNPDVAASVARTVLGTMSQEQKDQLLVQLVTKNREKLLDKGNQAARSRGIGVQLCDVAVRKPCGISGKFVECAGLRLPAGYGSEAGVGLSVPDGA